MFHTQQIVAVDWLFHNSEIIGDFNIFFEYSWFWKFYTETWPFKIRRKQLKGRQMCEKPHVAGPECGSQPEGSYTADGCLQESGESTVQDATRHPAATPEPSVAHQSNI